MLLQYRQMRLVTIQCPKNGSMPCCSASNLVIAWKLWMYSGFNHWALHSVQSSACIINKAESIRYGIYDYTARALVLMLSLLDALRCWFESAVRLSRFNIISPSTELISIWRSRPSAILNHVSSQLAIIPSASYHCPEKPPISSSDYLLIGGRLKYPAFWSLAGP